MSYPPAAAGYGYLTTTPAMLADRLSATYLTDYGPALTMPPADAAALEGGAARPDQLAIRAAPNGTSASQVD